MTEDELRPLFDLAQAQFDKAQAELNRVKQQEANIRRQIADLDEMSAKAALTDPESLQRLQRLGAQEIWLSWSRRKRAGLNTDLAGVLSKQDGCLAKLREAFGRRDALSTLIDEARAARVAALEKRREERVLAPYLIGAVSRPS